MITLSVSYAIVAISVILMVTAALIACSKSLARVWGRSSRFARYVFLAFVAGATLYGGSKNLGRVSYPYTDPSHHYLFDDGSYVTNDYVHVAFTKSALLPNDADFLGYVRPASSTNDADWAMMLESTIGSFSSPSNIPYAGAISNSFQFFTTWTPGPAVHTNGVAVILWQKPFDGSTNRAATIRTGIYLDGIRIAPNPAITNGPSTVFMTTQQGESNE